MARRLEKSYWLIQLAALVVLGLLVALGINSFLAARMVEALPAGGAEPEVVAVETRALEEDELGASAEPVLVVESRNLFNSADTGEPEPVDCAAQPGHPECAEQPAGGETPVAEEPSSKSTQQAEKLPLELIGTVVASDPRYYSAHLKQVQPAGVDHILKMGEAFEDFKLIQIKRNYVVFHDPVGGRLAVVSRDQEQQVSSSFVRSPTGERLEVPEPEAAEITTAELREERGYNTSEDVVLMAHSEDVQLDRDANVWMVAPELALAQADRAEGLMDALSLAPDEGAGGVRLGRVPSGSMFDRIGLEPGDVIVSVAGRSAGDVNMAVDFLSRLASKGNVVVKVSRNGETVVYQLKRSR